MTLSAKNSNPKTSWKAFIKRLVMIVLAVNLFIIAISSLWLAHSKRQIEDAAKTTTQNLAKVLEENISSDIDKADIAMQAAVDEIERQLAGKKVDKRAIEAYIARLYPRLPQVNGIRATDKNGVIVFGNGSDAHICITDRDFYIRAKNDPSAGLIISKPLIGRVSHKWLINLVRRINQPNGEFAGVMIMGVTLEHLNQMFSELAIGPKGSITLRDQELGLVTRYPKPKEGDNAISTKPSAEFQKLIQSGKTSGTFEAVNPLDHIGRILSYRKIPGKPFYVIVGLAADDYLSEWRDEALRVTLLSVFFLWITMLSGWMTYRAWVRQAIAGKALANHELKFRTMADFTYDWEYWSGPNQEIVYMTPSCERYTGYSQEAFMNDFNLINRIVHPEDRGIMEDHLHNDMFHDRAIINFRIIRKDGEIRWVAHGCRAVFGPNGEFLGRRISNRDMTEQIQIEKELQISEQRFKELFENMSSGVVIYKIAPNGKDFIFTSTNQAVEKIENLNRNELIGKSLLKTFPSVTQVGLFEALLRVYQTGIPEHFPAFFYQNSHTAGWRENFICKLPNDEIVVIYDDITERKELERRLKEQAHIDFLTGLANRGHFLELAEQNLGRDRRYGHPASFAMVDLDHFKAINDNYGHQAGDKVLKQFAKTCNEILREVDIIGRIGGEEFAILFPETNIRQAFEVAERLREAIAKTEVILNHDITIRFTVSIGIAALTNTDCNVDALLNSADKALYQAKNNGRNATCLADSSQL